MSRGYVVGGRRGQVGTGPESDRSELRVSAVSWRLGCSIVELKRWPARGQVSCVSASAVVFLHPPGWWPNVALSLPLLPRSTASCCVSFLVRPACLLYALADYLVHRRRQQLRRPQVLTRRRTSASVASSHPSPVRCAQVLAVFRSFRSHAAGVAVAGTSLGRWSVTFAWHATRPCLAHVRIHIAFGDGCPRAQVGSKLHSMRSSRGGGHDAFARCSSRAAQRVRNERHALCARTVLRGVRSPVPGVRELLKGNEHQLLRYFSSFMCLYSSLLCVITMGVAV
jgi:hypothetical protein